MFENRITPLESFETLVEVSRGKIYTQQYNTALSRFHSSLYKGEVWRLKKRILHRPQWLYDLNAIKPELTLRGSFYAGLQVVLIDSIIGSEGKTIDFDMGFHPLHESSRERWVSMAMAYICGLPLPPIQLIQIDNMYFVRDGHHRISVSRAFGQDSMDAEVITWQAVPPFPWQPEIRQQEFLLRNKLDPSA